MKLLAVFLIGLSQVSTQNRPLPSGVWYGTKTRGIDYPVFDLGELAAATSHKQGLDVPGDVIGGGFVQPDLLRMLLAPFIGPLFRGNTVIDSGSNVHYQEAELAAATSHKQGLDMPGDDSTGGGVIDPAVLKKLLPLYMAGRKSGK